MRFIIPFILLIVPVSFESVVLLPRPCRCLYGDPCWPSQAEFDVLAARVSQPLIQPLPPAHACYPNVDPSGNCTEVQANWQDPNWRADHAGAMQSPNFETFIFPNDTISACYLNTSLEYPCTQGSVPVIGVDARSPEDVQAAVQFASSHNLRLVVKNTGHDYLGRSAARGAFLIWTHHLNNITFTDSFIPDGGPAFEVYENALTVGAGVQWHEAYDAAHSRNVTLGGGLSAGGSVGAAGGWMQGGGHSALSPAYGLGVDNVLQLTVVIANGTHLTANAYQNTDIFWALRGGGGGTYGIVTSVTYRTRPSIPMIAAFFSTIINSTDLGPSPVLERLYTEFIRTSPSLSDAGWGGYASLLPGVEGTSLAFRFFFISPTISPTQANDSLAPYFEFAQSLAANSSVENGGTLTIVANFTTQVESFYTWETTIFRSESQGQVAFNAELGSRLLPRDVIEKNYKQIAQILLPLPAAGFHLVCGGVVSLRDPSSAGLNPAWRKAMVHAVFGTSWPEGANVSQIRQAEEIVKDGIAQLRAISPNSGAYFNEASLFEPNPQETFFGSHYAKLKSIKAKHDPSDLFLVAKGVGSEDWDESLTCPK